MLEEGRPVPLSSHRIINADEFGQALERLRINVPSSIRESERMLSERDAILAEARDEANKIVEQSRQQSQEMLTDNALVVAAQREADRIVADSHLAAQRRTEQADRYATDVLRDLADKLDIISQQVHNGISMLNESPAPATDEDEEPPSAEAG